MKDVHSCTKNCNNPWPGKQKLEVLGGGICHAFLTVDYRLLHQWLWKVTVSHATAHLHASSASDVPLVSSEFSRLYHPSHLAVPTLTFLVILRSHSLTWEPLLLQMCVRFLRDVSSGVWGCLRHHSCLGCEIVTRRWMVPQCTQDKFLRHHVITTRTNSRDHYMRLLYSTKVWKTQLKFIWCKINTPFFLFTVLITLKQNNEAAAVEQYQRNFCQHLL